MTSSAPRLPRRLLDVIEQIDDGKLTFAELCRRVGAVADELGLQRPSYERVRVLAQRNRRLRRLELRTADVTLDVLLVRRPAIDLLRHGAGRLPPDPP